jgi:hypothetical protein
MVKGFIEERDLELEAKLACGACKFFKRDGTSSWGDCIEDHVNHQVVGAEKPIAVQQSFGCKYFQEIEEPVEIEEEGY